LNETIPSETEIENIDISFLKFEEFSYFN